MVDPEKIQQLVQYLFEHPWAVVFVVLSSFGPTIVMTVLVTRRVMNFYTKDEIDAIFEKMTSTVDTNGAKAIQEVKDAHGQTARYLQKTSEEMGQITSTVNTLGKLVSELAGQSKVVMDIVLDNVRRGKTFKVRKATTARRRT